MNSFVGSTYIWMVGSSLIEKAHKHVKRRRMGVNLSLSDRYGVNVLWAGSSGLHFEFVINLCQALKNCYFLMELPTPLYLVIHAGGNDIGRIPTGSLRKYICAVLTYLKVFLPGTVIVWSCILPRLKWRHSDNTVAMEDARARINRGLYGLWFQRGVGQSNILIFTKNIQLYLATTLTYHSLAMTFS